LKLLAFAGAYINYLKDVEKVRYKRWVKLENVNTSSYNEKRRRYEVEVNLKNEAQEASRDRIEDLTNAIVALKLRREQKRKQEREKKCKAYAAIQEKIKSLSKGFNVEWSHAELNG
jgi:hypothetical protein